MKVEAEIKHVLLVLRLSGQGSEFTVSRFALFFISLKIVDESMNGSTGLLGLPARHRLRLQARPSGFVDIFELSWKYIF